MSACDSAYAEGRDCATELDTFYKQFMHVMSDPVENHGVTA
jgi:hypothetical protein